MQLVIAAWCFTFLSTNASTQRLNQFPNEAGSTTFSSRLSAKAKRNRKASNKSSSSSSSSNKKSKSGFTKPPSVIIFDLDGCLWRPELFELVTNADGPPFTHNPQVSSSTVVPAGTTLLSKQGQRIELLGSTRQILHELYTQEEWYPTRIGISSRTDPPEWAYNLMEMFAIYEVNDDDDGNKNRMTKTPTATIPAVTCQMKDVFDPILCILDKNTDKATQFERLLEQANDQSTSNNHKRLQFKDMVFFDNEAGNCKQVAKLGVTCVYTPKGVTYEAWQNAIQNFPANRVLGPKMPY
ncbi:unnamed protein product [Cylindrotheca closterium]|uniref:Magnesium-dependent phosphatase-1 n=1 Tax=Cylindrotheca closterium TaxID=2856 RepID=A0AAD2CI94_9STRA|nr:unnamed protein product [Cylindrotheca closterium]